MNASKNTINKNTLKEFSKSLRVKKRTKSWTLKEKTKKKKKEKINSKNKERDFPGGPVANTRCSQCRGPGFDPWSGNQIPHAATKIQSSQIKKNYKY